MRYFTVVFLLLLPILAACSSVEVEDYASNQPLMDPRTFFSGPLVAHGVIKDRSGKVFRRFTADILGHWQGETGTLEEDFRFADGETERRVWTLRKHADGHYTATAGDVIGEGRASVAGNAMFLDYVLRVPWRDGSIDLHVDDRMYLVNEDVLINESVMSKFGFRVGSILLTIVRVGNS
ncbi:DUF3833 domain-containing protein [Haliea sp. E17]|uniref:DUF3833 domain-containing protein n=1 Tax=Haliea sp. E17 TaxID=3401576 RepID=UPI003AAC9659